MASSTENRKELIMKNTNYLKIAAAATAAFMISAAAGFVCCLIPAFFGRSLITVALTAAGASFITELILSRL